MKIVDNVEMLEITGMQGGNLHPVLIWDEDDVVLVDAGLPGQFELIQAAVEQAGLSLDKVTKIILTHHDVDHMGNAKLISKLGAKILAHEKEAPYIQGDLPSPKLSKMEERLKDLSEQERMFYDRIKSYFPDLYVHVDELLHEGDLLPVCGGIEVVYTPGHTPGHISLLLKESNVLITGDAANASNGMMTGPNPRQTLDMPKAEESLEKLRRLNPDFIITYHGGLCSK